ncbi:hypothetical protein [Nonomuraea sp. B19D2]|uniref:hypothetical protein n=1 Tax=Nonomuraea sp. B19D2 TaxID=3159561 RepID=UPI0032D9D499
MPYIEAYSKRVAPEGGGGDYGGSKYDHLGFGTLTFTRATGGGLLATGVSRALEPVNRQKAYIQATGPDPAALEPTGDRPAAESPTRAAACDTWTSWTCRAAAPVSTTSTAAPTARTSCAPSCVPDPAKRRVRWPRA